MDRDYKTGKSDSVGIFSGLEIEHTPALGKQTLFLARNDLYFDQIVELAEKEAMPLLTNGKAIRVRKAQEVPEETKKDKKQNV